MAQHSPEPWDILNKDTLGCHNIISLPKLAETGNADDAEICCTVGLANDDEEWANSYLLAAAPDLSRVLDNIINASWAFYGKTVIPDQVLQEAKIVLAKAKGQTNA